MSSELSVLLPGLMTGVAKAIANRGADTARLRGEANRSAILAIVEKQGPIGTTAIATASGMTRESVSNHLRLLEKQRAVERLEGYYAGWVACTAGSPRACKK